MSVSFSGSFLFSSLSLILSLSLSVFFLPLVSPYIFARGLPLRTFTCIQVSLSFLGCLVSLLSLTLCLSPHRTPHALCLAVCLDSPLDQSLVPNPNPHCTLSP